MTQPLENIQTAIKAAMKAKETDRLSTLRMLLSEIKNEKIKSGKEVDETVFLQLVKRAIKQRKDSVEQYRNGGREELAAKEEREIEILSDYLPQQVGEDEIRQAIAELIEAEGLSGPKGIGPIMKAMMGRFGASADGGTINRIARELLG